VEGHVGRKGAQRDVENNSFGEIRREREGAERERDESKSTRESVRGKVY